MWKKEFLDKDWVVLMLEAKKLGLTVEEIKLFLNAAKKEKKVN